MLSIISMVGLSKGVFGICKSLTGGESIVFNSIDDSISVFNNWPATDFECIEKQKERLNGQQ